MKLKPELARLAKQLRSQGWSVQPTNGGHVMWTSPTGDRVYGAQTSGGGRGDRNLRAQLRRKGAAL